jgi:hypothetical protein
MSLKALTDLRISSLAKKAREALAKLFSRSLSPCGGSSPHA